MECGFDAVGRLFDNKRDSPETEAEWKAIKTHLENCEACLESAEELFEIYKNDPIELELPAGATNLWEMIELFPQRVRENEEEIHQRLARVLEKILNNPAASNELSSYLKGINELLRLLSSNNEQYWRMVLVLGGITKEKMIGIRIEGLRNSLINLKQEVGDEVVKEFFGIDFNSQLMGGWIALEEILTKTDQTGKN